MAILKKKLWYVQVSQKVVTPKAFLTVDPDVFFYRYEVFLANVLLNHQAD